VASIIKGLDVAKNIIGNFEFHEFKLLQEFHTFTVQDDGGTSIDIQIIMDTDERQPLSRICMQFHKISMLNIHDFGNESRIDGFDIVDISGHQLENISWQIFDFENDTISFYAKDVEIISAKLL